MTDTPRTPDEILRDMADPEHPLWKKALAIRAAQRTYDMKFEYHGTLMTHGILTLAELREDYPRLAALVEDDHINEVSYSNQDGEKRTIRRLYT